jgi:uncharacterized membrane protein
MELNNLFGLPAHPLLVHLPVVLVPMAGLLAILFVVRPAWLDRFGWWLVGLSTVGFVGAVLAAGSGESLESRVEQTPELERHAQLGEAARLGAFVFFVITVAVVGGRMWLRRRNKAAGNTPKSASQAVAIGTAVALTLGAAFATITVVRAGHQGAKVTWGDLPASSEDGK